MINYISGNTAPHLINGHTLLNGQRRVKLVATTGSSLRLANSS